MSKKVRANENVGGYVLKERLGRGGNGEVWRACDPGGTDIALKILTRAGREATERFQREVDVQRDALAGVQGLLPVLSASAPGDIPGWLAMPVAEPISHALADADLDDVLKAVADVADALGRLHDLGYAHRDVKPGNLYRYRGEWLVGDLGLVDLPEPTALTVGRRALGPKWFLAPEMLADPEGSAGGPADVYSLAKTLWVLMVGAEFPPPGTHVRSTAALRPSSFVQHPRVAFLDRLLERTTAHEPSQRPTAKAFARELRLITEGTTTPAPGDGPNLDMLREELRLAADASRRGDEVREERIIAGRRLMEDLVRVGQETREVLQAAEAPLAQGDFVDNHTVLDRANKWTVRNPEVQLGRCLVTTLRYETGLIGANRIKEIHMWSGFGLITAAEGTAVLIAAHIVGQSIVWSDSRLVPLGSMEAEQAAKDLASGLREYALDGLTTFLNAYKHLSRQS